MNSDQIQPPLPPRLRDVIARHGLATRKSLGQHFLLDYNLIRRIARAAGDLSNCSVIEIGPGPGGLTWALLEAGAAQVFAVERDRRCIPALAEIAALFPGKLSVIEDDALAIDPVQLCPRPRHIVANLPYNISTKLLITWLGQASEFDGLILMFQKEVADRLVAAPGSKIYGRLSILTQWLCEAKTLFDISPSAFTPPPKIASTLVSLTPRAKPEFKASLPILEQVTAAAFGQRRKMLRSSLKQISADPLSLLERAGIKATSRAEEISISGFCALARSLEVERTNTLGASA